MSNKPDNAKSITKPTENDNGTGVISALAEFPKEALLNENAMSRAFDVCDRTIRRMVTRYELPPPIRIAGRSTWIAGRVLAWLEEMAEQAEKDARKTIDNINRNNT